jgi:octaprenyl-diphosphate synthase
VHITYGEDTAINSGRFLYFLPLACIESWSATGCTADAGCNADVYALWAGYLRKLHLGQAIDIHWHREFDIVPSIEEYHAMCALKTGCLARFAAELGIMAAKTVGSGTDQNGTLGEAAEKLGIGFQILDDVKNLTTGVPGKKRGDDIIEGKKSLPVLLFLRQYPEKKEMVSRCFKAVKSGGIEASETEELINALTDCGVLKEAGEQGKTLIAEARAVFKESGELLAGFIDLIS